MERECEYNERCNERNEMFHLKLIYEKEFRKVTRVCGKKYRNKIPNREL